MMEPNERESIGRHAYEIFTQHGTLKERKDALAWDELSENDRDRWGIAAEQSVIAANISQDQGKYPAAVEDSLEQSCSIWAMLAEIIEIHIQNAELKQPDDVARLMTMAAQAEACLFRSTGEDDAILFDIPPSHYRIK